MSYRFIGKSLPRTEDLRLVRGLGRYTADLAPRDALRVFVVRSPYGAARIVNVDTAAAEAMTTTESRRREEAMSAGSGESRDLGREAGEQRRGSPESECTYGTPPA